MEDPWRRLKNQPSMNLIAGPLGDDLLHDTHRLLSLLSADDTFRNRTIPTAVALGRSLLARPKHFSINPIPVVCIDHQTGAGAVHCSHTCFLSKVSYDFIPSTLHKAFNLGTRSSPASVLDFMYSLATWGSEHLPDLDILVRGSLFSSCFDQLHDG
ncbi:hypothetical protein N657DRAFT_165470 [Parathielavia appendiculata]|uniref:Uncharacterized protein n=1 Tax=Parathielavia appendiculata TaxID=2587402 RepID=A0AAN6TTQ1_9PEZI|nr:hypothetical protein N657DRAFT_165470 [Parathielavia appendiculata]